MTIAISTTRLQDAACLLMFQKRYVTKEWKKPYVEHRVKGSTQHKIAEKYLRDGVPSGYPHIDNLLEPIRQAILAGGITPYIEKSFAVTRDYRPCAGDNWDNAWLRASPDMLFIEGEQGLYIDGKSGKPKDNDLQYLINFVVLCSHFPKLQLLQATALWWTHGKLDDPEIFSREYLEAYIQRVEEYYHPIATAEDRDQWLPTPSAWNCRYCPGNPKNGGDCNYAYRSKT